MNNTQQRILNVALDLFSQKGFSAASIRDICKVVDIKAEIEKIREQIQNIE